MEKIKVPWNANYYKKDWLELRDGGSDQWLYAVHDCLCFMFINIYDEVSMCGRDADYLFYGSVRIVDLAQLSPETIASSMSYVGMEEVDITTISGQLELAEACLDHGAAAVVWSDSGGKVTERFEFGGADESHPAFRKLRSDARKAALEYFDDEAREAVLDAPSGNAIGSTNREMMCGDIWAALRRIKNSDTEPTAEQSLVFSMYSKCDRTLGGEEIPKDLREVSK